MERRRATMDLNIESLYGYRGPEVERGKVKVEILYYRRDYGEGPVPGGFVVEQSRDLCCEFMVAPNPDLVDTSLGAIYDAVTRAGFHVNLKEEFICKMKLVVMALPRTATHGVGMVPELLVTLRIKTHPVVSTLTQSERARASALARRVDVPVTRRVRRRLDDNEAAGTMILERIRCADIFKGTEEWCCPICLDTCTSVDEEMTRLPCKHVFHEDCIFKWLDRSRSCPTCRRSLPAAVLL